jgi:hypothetical protein
MRTQIQTLKQEKSDSEELRNTSLENQRLTASELKWYSELKAELQKYGIPIQDISLFAKAVNV